MIYSGASLDADIPRIDLPSFALQRCKQEGDKPALIDASSGRTISYVELDQSVRSLAAGLAARGFGRGDTFALFMPNAPEYAVAFHGVVSTGARCTTVNPLYTARELGHQLADADASMLLTVADHLAVAREATAGTSCEVFVLGEAAGAAPFDELLGDPDDAPDVEIDPMRDIAAVPYSSGTTGLPKGVLLSHRNLVANTIQANAVFPLASADVVSAVLPFFHIYGLSAILNRALHVGATLVTMPRFEIRKFIDLLERHRVTHAYVVPPIVLALAKHPAVERRDLSSLRHIQSGAAPLGTDLAQACAARLGCSVSQGYGMTETSPTTHIAPPDAAGSKAGSIGPPIPGTDCRLVDPASGEDSAPGDRGELWIRGPQVMQGYLNNPHATAAMIDPEGWLHSGDLAVVDQDGWFTIVDRVKELIKYKGFQVAPAELEAILITHPQVADCAVIGHPDENAGELPKAFVVPASEALDSEAVVEFVAEQVAPHKRIRAIEIIDEIPKSPSGKILRRALRDSLVQGSNRVEHIPDPAGGVRVQAVKDRFGVDELLRGASVRGSRLHPLANHDDRKQYELEEGLCDPGHDDDHLTR
jgi:acyl-CoA synthetase (AMP-forming)/AMP-acid ligase II